MRRASPRVSETHLPFVLTPFGSQSFTAHLTAAALRRGEVARSDYAFDSRQRPVPQSRWHAEFREGGWPDTRV